MTRQWKALAAAWILAPTLLTLMLASCGGRERSAVGEQADGGAMEVDALGANEDAALDASDPDRDVGAIADVGATGEQDNAADGQNTSAMDADAHAANQDSGGIHALDGALLTCDAGGCHDETCNATLTVSAPGLPYDMDLVTSSPAGISVPVSTSVPSQSVTFPLCTAVTLTASGNSIDGYRFDHWSGGDCDKSTNLVCSLYLWEDESISALYVFGGW